MATGNDQADSGQRRHMASFSRFEKHGVYVTLQVIDGDERLVERESESFAIRHAYQKCANQAGATRDSDGVEIS